MSIPNIAEESKVDQRLYKELKLQTVGIKLLHIKPWYVMPFGDCYLIKRFAERQASHMEF